MAEREVGHIERAALALESTGDSKDVLSARIFRTVLADRGADIFSYRSPRQALRELENSENLSSRLNLLLASFNTAPKAATFLRIGDLSPRSEIVSWFRNTYVKKDGPRFIGNHVNSYVPTLVQFGMLEQGLEDTLRPTRMGQEIGQPVAAKFLTYEIEAQQSLYPVFGQEQVGSEESQRAPLTRAKILLELAQVTDRLADFSTVHQEPRLIVDSLFHLQNAGMVNLIYARSVRQGQVRLYRIANLADREKVTTLKKRRGSLAEIVAAACETLTAQGKMITAKEVYPLIPEEYRDTHNEASTMTNVHHFLSAFATEIHFLENTVRNQAEEIMQNARLTPQGQHLVRELHLPVVDALEGDGMLLQWKQVLLPRVQEDLLAISQETFELYAPHGRGTRIKDREILKGDIIVYVREWAPYATDQFGEYDMRTDDIAGLMFLPYATVGTFLTELVAEGKMERFYRKGYWIYRVPETTNLQQ